MYKDFYNRCKELYIIFNSNEKNTTIKVWLYFTKR